MEKQCYLTFERKSGEGTPEMWAFMDQMSLEFDRPAVDTIVLFISDDKFFWGRQEEWTEEGVIAKLPIFVFLLSDKDLEAYLKSQFTKVIKAKSSHRKLNNADIGSYFKDQWSSFIDSIDYFNTISSMPDQTLNIFESKITANKRSGRNLVFDFRDSRAIGLVGEMFETSWKMRQMKSSA